MVRDRYPGYVCGMLEDDYFPRRFCIRHDTNDCFACSGDDACNYNVRVWQSCCLEPKSQRGAALCRAFRRYDAGCGSCSACSPATGRR